MATSKAQAHRAVKDLISNTWQEEASNYIDEFGDDPINLNIEQMHDHNLKYIAILEQYFKDSDIDEIPAEQQDDDDEQATATFYMEPKQNQK